MATKPNSAVATLTLPFRVVNGMWGMNFEHSPLHNRAHGFMILALAQRALGFDNPD
jgi:magnesium transporter